MRCGQWGKLSQVGRLVKGEMIQWDTILVSLNFKTCLQLRKDIMYNWLCRHSGLVYRSIVHFKPLIYEYHTEVKIKIIVKLSSNLR